MYIGADYYPEHWDRKRWAVDARLMQKAGFNVTRLAEFAWAMMEPAEGRFEFEWLDDALTVLRKHGISVILCTPTAVAPAWAVRKYPEIMRQNQDGTRQEWGVRKDQCYSCGAYRRLSKNITRAMTEHFAATPNVIGWQTDNEFDGRACMCNTCRSEFQDYLRREFQTLDNLNQALGKRFWGHYASTWEELEIPFIDSGHNPSMCLEWRRFNSWLNVRFQREQIEIIRENCPKHFVTHNLMGTYPPLLNDYDLAEDLDVVSWDNYMVAEEPYVTVNSALSADIMRGCKKKNYWIMETTAGPHGWGAYGRNPWPGELRVFAYQQLAHGCDHHVWFRWRTCTAGREQYWHGILGHDGRPLRRYRETSAIAKEFHKLAKYTEGTAVKAQAAFIYDYDSKWAVDFQPGYDGNDYVKAVARYYEALMRAGVNVDIVKPGDDLSKYRLVLAPDLYILPDDLARQIDAYVKKGGVFFCDLRTGVKDKRGICHERTLPGLLSDALGIEIQEYGAASAEATPERWKMEGRGIIEGTFSADKGVDYVTARHAEVIVGYKDWFIRKFGAVTRNEYGKGYGWYCGTVPKEPELYDRLIACLLKDARIRPVCTPPQGVEVSVRQGKGNNLLFLMNYMDEKRTVRVPGGKRELITGRKTGEALELPRFGVAVVKL